MQCFGIATVATVQQRLHNLAVTNVHSPGQLHLLYIAHLAYLAHFCISTLRAMERKESNSLYVNTHTANKADSYSVNDSQSKCPSLALQRPVEALGTLAQDEGSVQ